MPPPCTWNIHHKEFSFASLQFLFIEFIPVNRSKSPQISDQLSCFLEWLDLFLVFFHYNRLGWSVHLTVYWSDLFTDLFVSFVFTNQSLLHITVPFLCHPQYSAFAVETLWNPENVTTSGAEQKLSSVSTPPIPLAPIHITTDRHFNFCLILSDSTLYCNFSRTASSAFSFYYNEPDIKLSRTSAEAPWKENYSKETLKSSVWWSAVCQSAEIVSFSNDLSTNIPLNTPKGRFLCN